VAEVTSITGHEGALRVERAIPGGVQVLEISGPAVLAASADAAAPRVPGMKDLLAAGKKPVELLELAALKVPVPDAVMTVTGRSRPERKAREAKLIDAADPAQAAAELVTALRQAGAL
jgi:electron transfer flavoprotein beta subunit